MNKRAEKLSFYLDETIVSKDKLAEYCCGKKQDKGNFRVDLPRCRDCGESNVR